jgi:hypothetical protein
MAILGQYTVLHLGTPFGLMCFLIVLEHICSPGEAPMTELVNYKTNTYVVFVGIGKSPVDMHTEECYRPWIQGLAILVGVQRAVYLDEASPPVISPHKACFLITTSFLLTGSGLLWPTSTACHGLSL